MTRVRLLNVKYSPNLGDGVIADCLELALASMRPGWDLASVDLAGRTAFADGGDNGRGLVLSALSVLPTRLRDAALAWLIGALVRYRYRARWAGQLEGTDAVIIGGGQLLSDAGLNFSQKIAACLDEASATGSRAAIFAVGVSGSWTRAGQRQFLEAFRASGLVHVAVRDARSQANWDRHTKGAGLPAASLCRDPGLLAAEVYGAQSRAPSAGPRSCPVVGVGITHPNTLALHGEDRGFDAASAIDFWAALAGHLTRASYHVRFFTNGAADDEAFLTRIQARLGPDMAKGCSRAARPLQPAALVNTIAGMDGLIAHRLHANIVAYAYRIPSVGLGWDAKLPAWFESVGRLPFVADASPPDPADVATRLSQALATPIDAREHAAVLADTRAGIARCAEAIDTALARSQAGSEIEDPGR